MSRGEDKDFSKFISGEIDTCSLFLGREKGSVSSRYSIVDIAGNEVFAFWKRNGEQPFAKKKYKGEYTNGQKAYTMILHDGVERIRGEIPLNYLGVLYLLSPCIEMGTGRLRNKRSKKSMTLDDLSKYLYISKRMAGEVMREFSKFGVITYKRGKGYYISRSYLLRGVKRDEEGKTVRETTDSEGT